MSVSQVLPDHFSSSAIAAEYCRGRGIQVTDRTVRNWIAKFQGLGWRVGARHKINRNVLDAIIEGRPIPSGESSREEGASGDRTAA